MHLPDESLTAKVALQSRIYDARMAMEQAMDAEDWAGALEHADAMVGLCRDLGEGGEFLVGAALTNAGFVRQQRGEVEVAIALYEEALGLVRASRGPSHRAVGSLLANLATCYKLRAEVQVQRTGQAPADAENLRSVTPRPVEAIASAEVALDYVRRARRVREVAHADEADVAATLAANDSIEATVMRVLDGSLAAEPLARRSHKTLLAALGADHPLTATAANNLALLCKRLGKLDEAEVLYREALRAREQRLGPAHRDTVVARFNLARLLEARGKTAEADNLQKQVLRDAK
jgi:tetratricopeptide (TPR) repeat protein